ncbi:MAG: hypothetical protein JNJ54_15190 [Myxococcaceae bacterium]|nr:hypothetical protein [Myxococcaceae bacterium]
MRPSIFFSAVAVPVLLVGLGAWFFVAPTRAEVSQVEARALAKLPAFTFEALRSGRYAKDLDLYVADHFPLREHFVSFTFALRARFGVRRESTVYKAKGGALGGFEQQDWAPVVEVADAAVEADPFADEDAGTPDAGDDAGVTVEADDGGALVAELETDDAGVEEPVEPRMTEMGGVLIHKGRGMMLLDATDETATKFAKVLASYGAAFPRSRVYAVMVPGAGAFYLPLSQKQRSADELHNLAVVRDALPPSVTWVDVAAALAPHASEPIYYRTDHHWTGLGAYYAYRAMLEAAGLEPLPRASFEWKRLRTPTLGSLFRMTQDLQLERAPDVTEYPVPPVEYQSVSYVGAKYDVPQQRRFLDEKGEGYLVYMGGDAALMAAKAKGVKNGRRALLVKNSFGNPLGPLLLPHFEQVVVVDYRMYFGTVASLVKRFRITDVFVQNATLTANDPYHRGRLKLALFTTVTFTDGGVVFGKDR